MILQIVTNGRFSGINPKLKSKIKLFLLALFFAVIIFMFNYVPLFGWIYSFFNYDIGTRFMDFSTTQFVGLESFYKIIQDHVDVLRVLKNSLTMSGLGLLFSPLPIVFAILLNEINSKRFR